MDRRAHARKYFRVPASVEIPSGRNPVSARLLDISLGGAFVEVTSLLRKGSLLILQFRLPDSRPQNTFRLYAKVMRRVRTGVGVAFLRMPAATLHALDAALSQLPQPDSGFDPVQKLAVSWAL